jgi:hypothetical protein
MAESTDKHGSGAPDVKPSRTAQAGGHVGAERLTPGLHYSAIVQTRQADGTYTVLTESPRQQIHGVRLAVPVLGGLMGLKLRCNLPPHTAVKIAYGSPSFIFCVLPENNSDWLNARSRSMLWGDPMDQAQGVTKNIMSDHAEDLIEGEVELTNMFGIALEFLTTLIRMKAGDRAVVECHLINDMVRILSAQYRHISGLGEELIFDHGRPNMERAWSTYRHEVLGIDKEKEPFAELNGDEVDRKKLEERRVTGLGRTRFREFLGFAGDFIHSFVSDPPKSIVSLGSASDAKAGAGKSWIHRNTDGSIVIQSVADIRIERTCRIPVAVRIAHHEDPEITAARAYDALTKDYLRLPSAVSPANPLDLYKAAYHIRSYSRWLGRYHAFARMLQQPQEYSVPSEAESPTPDWRNREADREDVNTRANYTPLGDSGESAGAKTLYYDAYACITIMRDGSIVNHDGYGASFVMSNGNVQISAPKHIDIEAAGDIRMTAGGSILMKARRNIELSAMYGGLVMHSYAWFKMLCEKGTLWLRSNAVTDKDTLAAEPAELGMPTPEVAGWAEGYAHGMAILVEAAEGHAAYRSQMGASLVVDGKPADDDDDRYNTVVSTDGDLDVRGKRKVDVRSAEQTRVIAGKTLVLHGPSLLSNADEIIVGKNPADPDIVLRDAQLWCRSLHTKKLQGEQIIGPERKPARELPDTQPTLQLKSHLGHIDVFYNNTPPDAPEGATPAQVELIAETRKLLSTQPELPWDGPNDGPKWAFPPKEEYVWDNREETDAGVPETLTQQYLRLDIPDVDTLDRWGGVGYKDWALRRGITGKRIKESGGFWRHEILYRASDTGENLHAPSDAAATAFDDVPVEWMPVSTPSMKALKRPEEEP